jgi:hypothetical protein
MLVHIFIDAHAWEMLGHRHMSSGGPYIIATIYMFHGAQVYQEEPSGPTAGVAEVEA